MIEIALKIEGLAAAVLHARPEHQRQLSGLRFDRGLDVFMPQDVFARARRQLQQRGGGIVAVPVQL